MPQATPPELDRFLVLFDRLVTETNLWIERTPEDKLDWVPIDTPEVRFGDRISKVTIKSLYVHLAVAEYKWARDLNECADGATIALPKDPELTASVAGGDFVAEATKMHQETLQRLKGYTTDVLDKNVYFAGDNSNWSGMGFLWGMYGHRAYHLGNLDIYLRQSNTPTPDFFSFMPKAMA